MRPHSTWREIRLQEAWHIQHDMRRRHTLWLHGICIGLLVVGAMVLIARMLSLAGLQSLALRYFVTLGCGYLAYLVVLRIWAAALLPRRNEKSSSDWPFDLPGRSGGSGGSGGGSAPAGAPRHPFSSGQGGDFGGGGAAADFDVAAFAEGPGAASGLAESASGMGEVAGGVAEAAAGADEAAVIVVPVLAVFLLALGVLSGAGALVLFFGSDVLLAIAVELAFGFTAVRTVREMQRDGWLAAAVRLTWKPMLGVVACAVLLGGAIDLSLPQAHSLPDAVRMLRAR